METLKFPYIIYTQLIDFKLDVFTTQNATNIQILSVLFRSL